MRSSNGRRNVRSLLLGGDIKPDPRFTLANERTFLAWSRTVLGYLVVATICLKAAPRTPRHLVNNRATAATRSANVA